MRLNEFIVPGSELNVSVKLTFDSADISGETSSTSRVHKGIKAKTIEVTSVVAFKDKAFIAELYQCAQAVDVNNDLVVYNITDNTANAANIRQVTFYGSVTLREMATINAWRLRFELREHLSVPEKKEQRLEQVSSATSPNEPTSTNAIADEPEIPLTRFEQVLKVVDDSLA